MKQSFMAFSSEEDRLKVYHTLSTLESSNLVYKNFSEIQEARKTQIDGPSLIRLELAI
jgi:hypothetical protein